MEKKKERRTWEEMHEIWNEVAEEYGMTGEELRKAAMPWPAGAIEKGLLDEENLRKALKNKGYESKNEMDRNEDPRDQIIKQNNPNPYRDDAEERMNKHIENINKQKRMERNTAEHGPILAKFIEDGREHEAEQIKENIKKVMKRGMLSKEDEKKFMEKFGTFKKLYEAPTVTLIDEKTLDPIDVEPDSIDQVNYVGTGEEPEGLPVIALREYSFDDILWKLREIHARKNHDYGNAAHESYKEFGFISYVIRLNDKLKRLKSLTKPGVEQQVKEESIVDTLMDLAAYSIMAIESLKSEEE